MTGYPEKILNFQPCCFPILEKRSSDFGISAVSEFDVNLCMQSCTESHNLQSNFIEPI